jgi:KipI family sensor histidine kinase inhibitor
MDFRILPAGDAAWLIELPERIDPEVNERAIQIARTIENLSNLQPPTSNLRSPTSDLPVRDVVVGYRSVMVFIDPLDQRASGIDRRLHQIAESPSDKTAAAGALVEVPVCYDGAYGPDLGDVAAFARCTIDDVIAMHLGREYRVFVVGFVPGFAYMANVDPRIAAPRRNSPRLKVPAGSVAVAAGQTGVYPAETPGGWSLIGRCPIRPYDPDRGEPFLFRPGDRVRFRPITEDEYRATSQWGDV